MTEKYFALLERMADDTLDACDFDHRAHVGVAFEAVTRLPFFTALSLFARGIKGAAERSGVPDKFHATVTFAFMSLIAERAADGDWRDAEDFIERNPDLCDPAALDRWYSTERIESDLARSVPLLPDRKGGAAAPD